jgi:hypothetical protein
LALFRSLGSSRREGRKTILPLSVKATPGRPWLSHFPRDNATLLDVDPLNNPVGVHDVDDVAIFLIQSAASATSLFNFRFLPAQSAAFWPHSATIGRLRFPFSLATARLLSRVTNEKGDYYAEASHCYGACLYRHRFTRPCA